MATNELFDEAYQNTLEKWSSIKVRDSEQLRTDALMQCMGEILGLGTDETRHPWGVIRGFQASTPGGLQVTVAKGFGIYRDVTAGWLATGRSEYRPLFLPADVTFTSVAADPVLDRYDVVLLKPALYDADVEATLVKDAVTGLYLPPQNLKQRLRTTLRDGTELYVKTGVPGAGVPAADPDTVVICQWRVVAAAAVVSLISDNSPQAIVRATRPYLHVALNGSVAGAFADYDTGIPTGPTNAIEDDSLTEQGGAKWTLLRRDGVGEWTLGWTGMYEYLGGSSGKWGLPILHLTRKGVGYVYYSAMSATGAFVWAKQTDGVTLDDCDLFITVSASGNQGSALVSAP